MRVSILPAVLALLLIAPVSAQAHAHLERTDPRVDSTLHTAPQEVTLWFSQDLEPAFSTMEVTDESGARVDVGKPIVDASDRKVMRIAVKPLSPGAYKVSWRVLSVDTHTTEGTFTFRVGG
jgi:copper resistance protein C